MRHRCRQGRCLSFLQDARFFSTRSPSPLRVVSQRRTWATDIDGCGTVPKTVLVTEMISVGDTLQGNRSKRNDCIEQDVKRRDLHLVPHR